MNLHRGNGSRGPAGTSGGGTPPESRTHAEPSKKAENTAAAEAGPGTAVRGPATAEPAPEAPPPPPEALSPAPASFPAPTPSQAPRTAMPSTAHGGPDGPAADPATGPDNKAAEDPAENRLKDRAEDPAEESADVPAEDPAKVSADIERLSQRMDRAVRGFVDDPQRAVREADAVLDAATELIEQRRKELRQGWDGAHRADTEELRVALTHYRDLTRRLITLTTAS